MRIVAGKYRGRILSAPLTLSTRPTSDRARESVFNILDSRLLKCGLSWSDLKVLDAFAGTGAMGVEAASRGAMSVSFMEKNAEALKSLRANVSAPERDGCRISIYSDVLLPPNVPDPADIIFMDPPYGKGMVLPAIQALAESGWLVKKTLCVVETERKEDLVLPPLFETHEERVYGKAKISFVSIADPFFAP